MRKDIMVRKSKGGYRQPTPSRKNAVSGPGALSQRTDGNQPVMRLPNADYGESAAYEAQQQAAPLGDGGGANMPMPLANAPIPDVFGPTERPGLPLTDGAPLGAGASPVKGNINDDETILLNEMISRNPHPILLQLLHSRPWYDE